MKYWILLVLSGVLLCGCSMQKLALRSTTGLFSYGLEALYSEPDLEIAEVAIASNLKLLEGFHRAEPENKKLLLMLAQGYASYSVAFLEDEHPERASALYLRAREYGFQLLKQTRAFKDSIPTRNPDFAERLSRITKTDLPALFWSAFSWAGWINLNRNNAQAVFDLSIVKAMMNRVLELDEAYYFASAHLFWGSIDGSIPKMLGGNPEKARKHFEKALEVTRRKFLLAHIYYARHYAAITLDEALFDKLLTEVAQAPVDILPGYELMTALAKRKASMLKREKEELF